MNRIKTPVMDKYGLHPVGGYCDCRPWSKCTTCVAIKLATAHWEVFEETATVEEKIAAKKESYELYPSAHDNIKGGR